MCFGRENLSIFVLQMPIHSDQCEEEAEDFFIGLRSFPVLCKSTDDNPLGFLANRAVYSKHFRALFLELLSIF